MKYLFLDTETSGLYAGQNGILTGYFVETNIVNQKVKINYDNELDLSIQYNASNMPKINARALEINGIDMKTFKGKYTPKQSVEEIIKLKYKIQPEGKLRVGGHNVKFDKKFLAALFDDQDYNFYDYFMEDEDKDTYQIAMLIKRKGKLDTPNNKLTTLIDHFKIKGIGGQSAHEAKYDTIASIKVLEKFYQIAKTIWKKQ